MAGKKGPQFKKEARKVEEVKKDKFEIAGDKSEKVATKENILRNQEVYNVATGQSKDNTLLGFQGEQDFYSRGRGRGDYAGPKFARGGGRGKPTDGGARKGRGGNYQVTEEEFPTL